MRYANQGITISTSVTTNTKHQSTKAYNMVKGENGTMDRRQNRTTEKKYAPAETLGPDGGPLMPKSAPGAAGGPSGKETSTHHLFPSKMVKTEDKAGADDGGAHAQDATIGTPGGGTQHAPRPTPGATERRRRAVEMESLQFVGCSWFIGLIGLVSDSPKINSLKLNMSAIPLLPCLF